MTAYLVVRQIYEEYGLVTNQDGWDTGSRLPLGSFFDRAAAEAFRAALVRDATATMNPFLFMDHHDIVPMEGAVDWPRREQAIRDAVVASLASNPAPPPTDKNGTHDWPKWYDEVAPTLTDADRVRLWNLFTVRPVYDIIEIEVDD